MIIPKKRYKSNEIFVNLQSNFKSQLVRCQKIMNNIEFDEVVIRGLGKAMGRSERLAQQLNENNYRTFDISKEKYTLEIEEDLKRKAIKPMDYDMYDPDDEANFIKKNSSLPALKIVVRKNKLELDKLKQLRKSDIYT